jgi:hypothetical protein
MGADCSVNHRLTYSALLFLLGPVALCQSSYRSSDCSTLKYIRHKVSCLCGTVEICSGDICGSPSVYEVDGDISVELRDKNGTTVDTQKVVVETIEEQGTTQDGRKTSFKRAVRRFSFQGKLDGDYLLAFTLHKNGVSQPALIFPARYSHKRKKLSETIYMLEPTCPK